jgi:hypothetical protein
MSEVSNTDSGRVVIGEPLLRAVQNAGKFEISVDTQKYFYTAASHRPLVKRIEILNKGWSGDDEIVVSVHTEAVGTHSLIHPWAKAYPPIQQRDRLNIDVLSIRPNFIELANIEESVVGDIVVQVQIQDQVVAEHRQKVEFLAYNQWMFDQMDSECLAAFVFPNHPSVSRIMDGVRKRLGKGPDEGTTNGYQDFRISIEAGLQNVHQIARAIFEELQSVGLKYSDPPKSFEGFGQKVRTPDVVIQENAATCLDSTVLAASCLAAAGLSPLLFMVEGHAFPGWWTMPSPYYYLSRLAGIGDEESRMRQQLRPGTITNVNDFQALVNAGCIGSFESTLIANTQVTFKDVNDRHLDYSSGTDVNEFEGIVDVERVSVLGVRRLPNRIPVTGKRHFEIEIDRTEFEILRPEENDVEDSPDEVDAREKLAANNVPKRVRKWMDALLDVQNTNPLINLAQLPVYLPEKGSRGKRGVNLPMVAGLLPMLEDRLMSGETIRAVCLHRLDVALLNNPTAENVCKQFELNGTIAVGPIKSVIPQINHWRDQFVEAGLSPSNALSRAQHDFEKSHESEATKRFRSLKKYADETEAESASNQLFMTIGSLVWNSPGEGNSYKQVRSPLFVVPVRLGGSAATSFTITLDKDGEISPNYCMLEKLRSEIGLRIPELERPNLDDSGIDVANTISIIRRYLSESKFASVRVEEEAQLAVLDFATFRMWKDIQANWQLFSKNPVVHHLIEGSNATLEQDVTPFEGEPLAPFSCDESQMKAVRWALEGRSFVLEGPPGTGKSQTIANMVAACMAEGKRVLFVAEKQVALNAVSTKLEEIGLDPFCITMHHESTTPESIRRQLQISLDFMGEDVTRQWDSENAVKDSLQARLISHRDALIAQNPLKFNALTAHQEVLRLGDGNALQLDSSTFDLIGQNLTKIQSALLSIFSVVEAHFVERVEDWSLSQIVDVDQMNWEQLSVSISELQNVISTKSNLRKLIEPLLVLDVSERVLALVDQAMQLNASGKGLSRSARTEINDPSWFAKISTTCDQVSSLIAQNRVVFDFFQGAAFEIDLTPQMVAATEAVNAGLFKKSRRADTLKSLMTPIIKVPFGVTPAEALNLLQRVAPIREELNRIKSSFVAISHIQLRSDFNPLNQDHVKEVLEAANNVKARSFDLSQTEVDFVQKYADEGNSISFADAEATKSALAVWNKFVQSTRANPDSLTKWLNGRQIWDAIVAGLTVWTSSSPQFAYLKKMARIEQTLLPLRESGLNALADEIVAGRIGLSDVYNEFMRGLAQAARAERLRNGSLGTFDRHVFEKTLENFTRNDRTRRELMRKVIPFQLSQSRPFKPGVRTGQIGNLEKELGRKVRRVSVPQLIKEHGEMITRLAPCFLMSPEAVSRLLPADSQFFDIVIFDEASQVRVAAAIPAMGRAKSTIVVGDSQQMPPSKKIGKREISTEDSADLEEESYSQDLESILTECSESNLPSLMLKCHFRSQHEGLIAFSNRNFYDGGLVTFPAPNTDQTTPIHWFDVLDGQFIQKGEGKGTNPQEVTAVVAEVVRRLNDPEHASKSIGVVTFNEFQAAAIFEMLEAQSANEPALAVALSHPKKSERLFVVPLERVQGDERDTIILSVSYSYQNANRTSVSPKWGPLTHKGGERRLNVAITRAKRDLLIFCSFDPSHVSTENSTFKGVPYTVEFLKECRDAARTNGVALKARDASVLDYHRRKLLDMLRVEGLNVRENIGLSQFRIDLVVTSGGASDQFLAVLLDGEEWTKRSTPFDRDVLPHSVLRLIGWRRIGRVWLKSFVEDPEHVVRTVRNEVKRESNRQRLISELKQKGFEVRSDSRLSNLGVDLAVRKKGQSVWPLAVVVNGPELFSQFLSYEGNVPGYAELKSLNCAEALSVWMPDYESNPDAALAGLELAINKASENLVSVQNEEAVNAEPKKVSEIIAERQKKESDGPLLQGSDMRSEFVDSRSLPVVGDQSMLNDGPSGNRKLIRSTINEIVEFEGPITEARLASVLVGRFGMAALRSTRLASLQKEFTHLKSTNSKFGKVYWNEARPADKWSGFRTSAEETSRTIDEVPAEEISNAMVAVVRMGNSGFRDEIIRHTAEAFGREVIRKALNESLGEILDWTVAEGRLTLEADLYKLPG